LSTPPILSTSPVFAFSRPWKDDTHDIAAWKGSDFFLRQVVISERRLYNKHLRPIRYGTQENELELDEVQVTKAKPKRATDSVGMPGEES
jgi:hypothetical protein